MAAITQWATEDLALIIEDEQGEPVPGVLDGVSDVAVTMHQNGRTVTWRMDELDIDAGNSTVNLHMSQEKSGKLAGGKPASVQVNILYASSDRKATVKGELCVHDNLLKEVMR